jgi:hypothetical protein
MATEQEERELRRDEALAKAQRARIDHDEAQAELVGAQVEWATGDAAAGQRAAAKERTARRLAAEAHLSGQANPALPNQPEHRV